MQNATFNLTETLKTVDFFQPLSVK